MWYPPLHEREYDQSCFSYQDTITFLILQGRRLCSVQEHGVNSRTQMLLPQRVDADLGTDDHSDALRNANLTTLGKVHTRSTYRIRRGAVLNSANFSSVPSRF